MTRLMDLEGMSILMDLSTRDTGKKTSSMGMERRYGLMELSLRGII